MNKKIIELRQEANVILDAVVNIMVQNYKDLRYIQILWAIGIIDYKSSGAAVDRFYEEPIDTLKRCYNKIIDILSKTNNLHLEEEIDKLLKQI